MTAAARRDDAEELRVRPEFPFESNVPSGPLSEKWTRRRAELGLVGPVQKRRHTVVVVGSGLAGASAAATLSELGYRVVCLCFQDSPRRAHSVAAQGGINAAKNTRTTATAWSACSTRTRVRMSARKLNTSCSPSIFVP